MDRPGGLAGGPPALPPAPPLAPRCLERAGGAGPQPAEADLFVAEGAPESLPAGDPRREVLLRAEARPSVAGADVVSLPPFPTLRDHLGTPGFLVPTRGFPLLQAGSTHYRKWTGGIHGAAPAR